MSVFSRRMINDTIRQVTTEKDKTYIWPVSELCQGHVTENVDSLEKKSYWRLSHRQCCYDKSKCLVWEKKGLWRQQVGDNEIFTHDSWESLTLVNDVMIQVLQDFSQRATQHEKYKIANVHLWVAQRNKMSTMQFWFLLMLFKYM